MTGGDLWKRNRDLVQQRDVETRLGKQSVCEGIVQQEHSRSKAGYPSAPCNQWRGGRGHTRGNDGENCGAHVRAREPHPLFEVSGCGCQRSDGSIGCGPDQLDQSPICGGCWAWQLPLTLSPVTNCGPNQRRHRLAEPDYVCDARQKSCRRMRGWEE